MISCKAGDLVYIWEITGASRGIHRFEVRNATEIWDFYILVPPLVHNIATDNSQPKIYGFDEAGQELLLRSWQIASSKITTPTMLLGYFAVGMDD